MTDGTYTAVRRPATRLLPTGTEERAIALDLIARVETKPILSPHGHVDPTILAEDRQFDNPTELLVTRDHYLTRLLHADGVPLESLGAGKAPVDPRAAWRIVASRWHLFAGTATGYWMSEALGQVFDIHDELSELTADRVYDEITRQLATASFRPRALFTQFGIEVLATTDDPLDSLDVHRRLQREGMRVLPTFRPDRYLDPDASEFAESIAALLAVTDSPTTFAGYLHALQSRRQHFVDNGAVSADHGVVDTATLDLDAVEANALFGRVIDKTATADDRHAFRAHMLFQMARMSVEDGLVMTVHPGIARNHSTATLRRSGPDSGHDIPLPTDFVRGLRPLLERFGLEPEFHLVLFSVDETAFSREIAPLAGFYPSVFVGAPWWFLDAPNAIERFRGATAETAGFYRGSGFIDDTRAFLSIPARHNTARRADAAFLARWVSQGRLSLRAAERVTDDLVDAIPRKAFKL